SVRRSRVTPPTRSCTVAATGANPPSGASVLQPPRAASASDSAAQLRYSISNLVNRCLATQTRESDLHSRQAAAQRRRAQDVRLPSRQRDALDEEAMGRPLKSVGMPPGEREH